MKGQRLVLEFALALLLSTGIWVGGALATVWYVDQGAPGPVHDGSSWGSAFLSVQQGISAAAATGGGDVWVAHGVYYENIAITDNVSIFGNFNKSELAIWDRDFSGNSVTILDGSHNGSVISIINTGANDVAVNGFTIRNGYASVGGGIYCDRSNAKISNNIIKNNTAVSGGGGIYTNSSPILYSNIITHNTGERGGGIYIAGGNVRVYNNTIFQNVSLWNGYSYGGGIYTFSGAAQIYNNIVASCSSGIYSNVGVTDYVVNNLFYGNGGGGVSGGDYYGVGFQSNNIFNQDPQFVNSGADDYHIGSNSPCIDNGFTDYMDDTWRDMDGEPRVMPIGGTVDIGADEDNQVPPGATRTIPPDGATGVPLSQIIAVTFNEGIQVVPPESNIVLLDEKRLTPVNRTVSVDGKTLTITPAVQLIKRTTYSVSIPSFSIQDLAGNQMAVDKLFYFTTVDR